MSGAARVGWRSTSGQPSVRSRSGRRVPWSRGALLVACWVAACAGWLLPGGSAAASGPPAVRALFGCPLADGGDEAASWRPPATWRRTRGPGGAWSVAAPADWDVTTRAHGLEIKAPRGRIRMEASLESAQPSSALVRAAWERSRLGPSFAAPSCEARLSALVDGAAGATGATAPLVAAYGRPLGARRRAVAAFFTTPQGVLALTVTARWGRRDAGAPWPLLRRLLGGVRADLTPPRAAHDDKNKPGPNNKPGPGVRGPAHRGRAARPRRPGSR